jgi:hypothetical protein
LGLRLEYDEARREVHIPGFVYEVVHTELHQPDFITPETTIIPLGPLTEEQATAVMIEAGWPDHLIPEALSVACGIGNARWPQGESGCNPAAIGDSGNALGLFQLWPVWRSYCGITYDEARLPVANAACAWQVYQYDLDTGQDGWAQWSVKP